MAIVNANALIAGVGGSTNYLRNPRAEGAVVGVIGSGGAYPTYWGTVGTVLPTIQIIGTGTDATTGLPYIDIRFAGTNANGYSVMSLDAAGSGATMYSSPGDIAVESMWVAMVGGSMTNVINVAAEVREDVGPAYDTKFIPTATPTYYSVTATLAATAHWFYPAFTVYFIANQSIDITLRIIAPQFERLTATSLMMPPPGSPGVTVHPLQASPNVFTTPVLIPAGGGSVNSLYNPNGEGAVVGTLGSGGVLPTNWSLGGGFGATSIVNTGIDTSTGIALNFVDIRFNFTTSSTATTLRMDTATFIPMAPSDVWSVSGYVALIAGTLPASNTVGFIVYVTDANGVTVTNSNALSFVPNNQLQRYLVANRTLPLSGNSRHAWPCFYLQWPNATAIDFTLRIAGLQVERGTVCTPLFLPPLGTFGPLSRALIASPIVPLAPPINGAGSVVANPYAVRQTSALIAGSGGNTNFIRNANLEGAIAGIVGSGGSYPTYWAQIGVATGLTATIIGSGIDAATALPYVDIQFSGTTVAGATFQVTSFDVLNAFASPGDAWTGSAYVALIGGSFTNIAAMYLQQRWFSGSAAVSANLVPLLTSYLQRFSVTANQPSATGTIANQFAWYFTLTGNVAINVTFRIAAPQFEKSPFATPPIFPPAGSPQITTRGLLAMPTQNPITIGGQGSVSFTAGPTLVGVRALLNGQAGDTYNWLRNPRGEGATIGTNLYPTYWSTGTSFASQMIGTGIDGTTLLPYIDIRQFGTVAATAANIRLDTNTGIWANANDVWSMSLFCALVGGSNNGGLTTFQIGIYMTDANGNILSPPTIYTTCNLTGTMQRFLLQNVTLLNNANIAHIWPVIAFTTPANTAVDFTLRLGGIQVERGPICTALSLPLAGSPGPSASLPSPNALALTTPVGINGAGGKVNYVRNALGLGGTPGVLGQSGVAPIEYSINAVPGCTVEFQGAYVTPEGIPVTRWRFLGTTTTTNPFGINWFRAAPIQNQPKFSGGVVVVSNYYRLYAGSTSGIANFQHWGESFDAANVAQPYPGNGWNPQPNTDLNRTVGTLTFNVAGTPPYRIQSGGVVIYTTGIGAVIDCT